ncbi:MAG TPA: hypothetical protein VED40_14990 [Azospirillaceae bacterium]|nr:hypothetical protein [Azospirillaceae bacterium]
MKAITDEMTIGQLRSRLRRAHDRMGGEGRVALTLNQEEGGPGGDAYVTHWTKPDGSAFEDCRAVGAGTVAECLAALDRYAGTYVRKPTVAEVGRTLGVKRPAEADGAYPMAAE